MVQQKAFSAYQNSKILTASPAELTLMLYDGAIKFCNIAIMGVQENNIEKAHNNIRKVERIIQEFIASLDDRYEVAKDFHKVYDYLLDCLRDANLKKEVEPLQETLKHLRTMRETWKSVMDIASGKANAV